MVIVVSVPLMAQVAETHYYTRKLSEICLATLNNHLVEEHNIISLLAEILMHRYVSAALP